MVFRIYASAVSTVSLSCRGQKFIQQHQNVLPIRSMRRGGFRFEEKILNPNEESLQSCGWAVQAFTKPGMFESLGFIISPLDGCV